MGDDKEFRVEKDAIGERLVPAGAYYGIQTLRAAENFPVSGIMPKPVFVTATAMVKKAAAMANVELGLLDRKRGAAIIKAADEVVSGLHRGEFFVDVYQAGAGTSHNMNANEVIANRAIEILGGVKGSYSTVHPNDHVNMSQSTNDTMPTALRVACLLSAPELLASLKALQKALERKSVEFNAVIKSGRTHLQDAVPVRLGSEFGSYASSIKNSMARLTAALDGLKHIGLGGTAAGTGINTHPSYRRTALRALSKVSGIKGLKPAPDNFEALNGMGDFTAFSSTLKNAALELIRIANDLRLLSSGPRTGLSEITLPAVQPGSSIMPGKVNPVIAEMLDMVGFQVVGFDLTVALAAQAGQLELNVMLPVINYNILQSVEILTTSVGIFAERCVSGIKADRKRCRAYFEGSVGLATALNRFIGYEKAAAIAKESASTGKTVKELVIEKGLFTEKEWKAVADASTGPSVLKKIKKTRR
jgi:aspartate ammonia-lyase